MRLRITATLEKKQHKGQGNVFILKIILKKKCCLDVFCYKAFV